MSVGAETREFDNAALRALASDWRFSGIFNARSGSWLTVTTGRDISGTGIAGQRVNQVLDNPYGDKGSLTTYLNPAAFAYPAAGTLGDHINNSIEGPGFWTVDLAVIEESSHSAPSRRWSCGSRCSISSTTSTGATRTRTSMLAHSAASRPRAATRGSCSSG